MLSDLDPELLEGRDYAFVVYGGALLAAIGLDDSDTAADRVVDALKISHRPVIVCDRDVPDGEPLKAHVERLKRRAGELGTSDVVTTPGVEIENLVASKALLDAFRAELPKTMETEKGEAALAITDTNLDVDRHFSKVLADAATLDGKPLDAEARRKFLRHVSAAKVSAAMRVVAVLSAPFTPAARKWGEEMIALLRK